MGTYGSIINPGVKTLSGGVVSVSGPSGDPTEIVLRGREMFARGAILSLPPSVLLPRGLLSHVSAVSYRGGDTTASLSAASIYEVAPSFQFDVPLADSQASAAALTAGCGGPSGVSPYRHIKDISFSGGWNTVTFLHIPIGVRSAVHFTAEAGVTITGGLGLDCSLQASISANGMAGPIPVTAAIQGELSAFAGVGGILESGGSLHIDAGASTVGVPPALLWAPEVSFSNPKFNLTAQKFAQATAGIGVAVKLGIGNDNVASATLNLGSSLDLSAQPGACAWNARFGQFSAEGKLLRWSIETPKTPALFTKQLWQSACGGSTGGGGGGGGGGGPSGPSGPPGAGWNLQPLPGISGTQSGLSGVSCVASSWCLAVGADEESTLTEVWNGSSWSFQATPNVGSIFDVSCTATTWCMAVGSQDAAIWNGNSWQAVALPAIGGTQSTSFLSDSCVSSSDCIMVGQANYSNGEFIPISARWDGAKWSLLSTPSPSDSVDTDLVSVSCSAENSCTAVGGYDNDEGLLTGEAYAERWNGSSWTLQTTPNPGGEVWSGLNSVSCPTTTSCVAVGYWNKGLGTSPVPLAESWNGTSWSSTGAVLPADSGNGETAYIACSSSSSCEAVGQFYKGAGYVSLAETWNGSSWSVQPSPNPPGAVDTYFSGVSCLTSTRCVAVGSAKISSTADTAFAESYSGS